MKKFGFYFAIIAILAFLFLSNSVCTAQSMLPQWVTELPVKKGFVYGVGKGVSADLPMAIDKARIAALRNLNNNYLGRFEQYAAKCDTILGANNEMREVVSSIKLNQASKLSGIEEKERLVRPMDYQSVVYILLEVNVHDEISLLQKAVNANKILKRKMDENGLLKELEGF